MATQWPVVRARLVTLLPTLTGWSSVKLYDGPPVTGDAPTRYCTVGYVDDEDAAGDFSHVRAGNGFQVEETGGVRCELVTSTGSADLAPASQQGFTLIDKLEESIRADQTLGVLPPGSTSALTVDVIPVQSSAGAYQRLVFTVGYFTRT